MEMAATETRSGALGNDGSSGRKGADWACPLSSKKAGSRGLLTDAEEMVFRSRFARSHHRRAYCSRPTSPDTMTNFVHGDLVNLPKAARPSAVLSAVLFDSGGLALTARL